MAPTERRLTSPSRGAGDPAGDLLVALAETQEDDLRMVGLGATHAIPDGPASGLASSVDRGGGVAALGRR